MKHSEGRIFTTHCGSLPRPDGLVELLASVARGESVDQPALDTLAAESTQEVIRQQAKAGVDVLNSGEQSRTSFSTYVTQRMSGFGGSWTRRGHRDQNEFPSVARPRVVQLMRDVPQCTGPLEYQRLDLAEKELDGLVTGVNEVGAAHQELFMSAASPGVIALTLGNAHYANHEKYVMALAEEMRKEYELITSRGVVLQLDCPDLAMERHVTYQDEPVAVFQEVVALHIQAINHAIRNIPKEQVRLHVCWGNSEGPHHYDVPLEDILPLVYEANVGALVMEMANPRHAASQFMEDVIRVLFDPYLCFSCGLDQLAPLFMARWQYRWKWRHLKIEMHFTIIGFTKILPSICNYEEPQNSEGSRVKNQIVGGSITNDNQEYGNDVVRWSVVDSGNGLRIRCCPGGAAK